MFLALAQKPSELHARLSVDQEGDFMCLTAASFAGVPEGESKELYRKIAANRSKHLKTIRCSDCSAFRCDVPPLEPLGQRPFQRCHCLSLRDCARSPARGGLVWVWPQLLSLNGQQAAQARQT